MRYKLLNISILPIFGIFFIFVYLITTFDSTLHDVHLFRQSQILVTTQGFLERYNLFEPYIPVFGESDLIAGFEIPIMQYLAARLSSLFGVHPVITLKLISVVSYFLCIVVILKSSLLHLREKSIILLSIIVLNPVNIAYVASVNIEFWSIAFALIAAFLVINEKNLGLILIVATIAAASKIIIFISFALLALLILLQNKIQAKRFIFLVIIFLISLTLFIGWNAYIQHFFESGFFISQVQTDSSWYLGDIQQRLSIFNNIELIFKTFIFVNPILILYSLRESGFISTLKNFFLTFLAGPFLFFNVHLVHDYYFLASTFMFSLLMAYDKKD